MLVAAAVGVPGVWELGGYLGGLYRVLPTSHPRTIFNHILASGPYLRPNEGNFMFLMRFPEMGLEKGPEKVQD